MGRPRKIENIYDAPKQKVQFTEGQKSKGILDDHAVRQNVASKEGTIEHTPTNDNHIANKKYVDDSFPVTHASTTGKTTDDHHAQSHNMASHSDDDTYNINTSGTATIGGIIYADGNVAGLGLDVLRSAKISINLEVGQHLTVGGNIAVSGTGVVGDHGDAATDQIINVCYGTVNPPDANTTTEGAIWLRYIA